MAVTSPQGEISTYRSLPLRSNFSKTNSKLHDEKLTVREWLAQVFQNIRFRFIMFCCVLTDSIVSTENYFKSLFKAIWEHPPQKARSQDRYRRVQCSAHFGSSHGYHKICDTLQKLKTSSIVGSCEGMQ